MVRWRGSNRTHYTILMRKVKKVHAPTAREQPMLARNKQRNLGTWWRREDDIFYAPSVWKTT